MSYDVYLEVGFKPSDKANSHRSDLVTVFDGNHTSNTGGMIRKALGGRHISELNGKIAKDEIRNVRSAITDLIRNRVEYAKDNPPNGWGSIDTTIAFMRAIYKAMCINNLAIIRVSY